MPVVRADSASRCSDGHEKDPWSPSVASRRRLPHQLQHSPLYLSLPEAQDGRPSSAAWRSSSVSAAVHGAADGCRPMSAPPPSTITTTGDGGGEGGASLPFAATAFMLQQQRAVAQYRDELRHLRDSAAREREAKWAQMRRQQREAERKTTSESIKKRRMRIAKQVAAQQLAEQHDRERELMGYEERKHRTAEETLEKRSRFRLSVALWKGVHEITLEHSIAQLCRSEDRERTEWLDRFLSELEQRHRQAIFRIATVTKTSLLTSEKAARITLQRHLAAVAAWKASQDAEVNAFMSLERKVRQKLHDEEAFGFIEIEGEKRALQQEQMRIAKRRQDIMLAARREHEKQQANARGQLEKDEGDIRNAIRTESDSLRSLLKQDYVSEKRDAEARQARRVQREREEWEAECMRQLQPLIADEVGARGELEGCEESAWNAVVAAKRQELDDILIPIAVSPSQSAVVFYYGGPQVAAFPDVSFRRKVDARHYPAGPVVNATLTVLAVDGVQLGDEVDIAAVESAQPAASSVGRKGAAAQAAPTQPLTSVGPLATLRLADSVLFDEEGSPLCSLEFGGNQQLADVRSAEEAQEINARMLEKMESGMPLLVLSFPAIDARENLGRFLDRVAQALVFRADPAAASLHPRTLRLQLSFSCAAVGSKLKVRTPTAATLQRTRTLTGPGSPARTAALGSPTTESLAQSNAVFVAAAKGALQDFCVSHTVVVEVAPMQLHLSCTAIPPMRSSCTTAVFDLRRRPDKGKLFVPLFSHVRVQASPHVSGGDATPCGLQDTFRGATLRLRCVEGYAADDFFQIAPNELFTVKKDEIRGPTGAPLAKVVSGKILPGMTTSTREVVLQILEEPVPAHVLESLVSRLNWSTGSASPTGGRRLIELVVARAAAPGAAAASMTLRCEVLVIHGMSDNATLRFDEPFPVVRYADSALQAPPALRQKLDVQRPVPLCVGATVEPHGNLATRDLITAGSLRISVIHNGYAWDTISVMSSVSSAASSSSSSAIGTLVVSPPPSEGEDARVLWSPSAGADVGSLPMVGKLKRFTHFEGKLRPGIQVDLVDVRVNVVASLLRSLTFATDAVTVEPVTKVVQMELLLPDGQARKSRGSAPTNTVRANVAVVVTGSLLEAKTQRVPIPRGPGPFSLDCFSFSDAGSVILDGGSLTIEFVDGSSGLEELQVICDTEGTRKFDIRRGGVVGAPTAREQQQLFVDEGVPVGTVGPLGMGRAVVVSFAGKPRSDTRLIGNLAGSVAVSGSIAEALLATVAYRHSESDSELQKVLRATLIDTFGCRHQAATVLDITPVHLPSELLNPPHVVHYRPGSVSLTTDGVLPLFPECTIIDEDTEFCGVGAMYIEPYVGVSSEKDQLVFLTAAPPHLTNIKRKLVFHDHPIDASKTSIHADGKEFAVCTREKVNGDTRLVFAIRSGTTLDLCTELMRRIGFLHGEALPTRKSSRQYLFRFNAGDEEVPDTRHIVEVIVNVPLLYTLPIYASATLRAKQAAISVFQKVILGTPPRTTIAGDALDFRLAKADSDDRLAFSLPSDDLSIEQGYLVASTSLARTFSATHRVMPTPGFSGVCIGTIEVDEEQGGAIALTFRDDGQLLTASFIQFLASLVTFSANPLAQQAPPRTVEMRWRRAETAECGALSCFVTVEPDDQMTEIHLQRAMIVCIESEPVPLAPGVRVVDDDTEFFESDATVVIEVQNGVSSQDFVSIVDDTLVTVVPQAFEVLVDGAKVAVISALSTARRLVLEPTHCSLAALEKVLSAVHYCGKSCAGRSKLVQIMLRASAAVPPSTANVQVSIIARPFTMLEGPSAKQRVVEHVASSGTLTPCITGIRMAPAVNLAGAQLHFGIASCVGAVVNGRQVTAGDRVTLGPLPEHLHLAARGVISLSGGPVLCNTSSGIDTPERCLTITFPLTTKLANAMNIQELLACVAYEFSEVDENAKSGDDFKKSPSVSASSKKRENVANASSPKAKGGPQPERGAIDVVMTVQLPATDGQAPAFDTRFRVDIV